jgi:hypothetical protein
LEYATERRFVRPECTRIEIVNGDAHAGADGGSREIETLKCRQRHDGRSADLGLRQSQRELKSVCPAVDEGDIVGAVYRLEQSRKSLTVI